MAIRVLLVDDEPMFLEALRALLDHDDRIDVVGATDSGHEALELARREHPDVALVDLAMPGVDGFEVTRELLASDAAASVVAVSGLSHEGDAERALQAGASAFLLKGGLYDEVAETIVAASEQARETGT
jgi:DNA-binding NarL/FixJ family response regulator